jgi:hypothetical protein
VSINRVESIQGHLHAIERVLTYGGLIPSNSMGLDVTEICFGNMGRILEKWRDWHAGIAPTFAKEFRNAHARVRTTTTSSVAPTN